jgi:CheY-like chemotaxis protein
MMEERKHELSVSLAAGSLRVDADPLRMEQILVNLLTNAAKYTDAGGKISLTIRREGDRLAISVRDTGIGISAELLPRVFDMFVQGDRSIARTEGGLGIGLTLVHKLAEMHDGSVTALSEGPGKGSEFIVRLPTSGQDSSKSPTESHSSNVGRAGARVLVVDDNADTALGLAKLLKLLGHDVQTASDGLQAVERAKILKPEIILLDIGLPGMNGYQVAQLLRQEDCCRDALLIAVSGYGQDEDRRRSMESGFDHHLVKPVDFNTLMAVIAEA